MKFNEGIKCLMRRVILDIGIKHCLESFFEKWKV